MVMGVLNVTPDSFSGDGIYKRPDEAARRAEQLVADGADIIDIGGESSRPGYRPVPLQEELERVIPAVRKVVKSVSASISVDTSKAEVARQALEAGASLVNDVSGLSDPSLPRRVAEAGASLVLVHNGKAAPGEDLMAAIIRDLQRQIRLATGAGVAPANLVLDPGLGMGKGWRENFEIIRRLSELRALELPILAGPSRKAMIVRVLGEDAGDRLEGSAALVALCVAQGADMVRVHDVKEMVRVARMIDAIVR